MTVRLSSINVLTIVENKTTGLEFKNEELLLVRTAFQKARRAPAPRSKLCVVVTHKHLKLPLRNAWWLQVGEKWPCDTQDTRASEKRRGNTSES